MTSVGGFVDIHNNGVLTDLEGLAGLTTIGGDVHIFDNPNLCQSAVEAFIAARTVGGTVVEIAGNNDGC